MAAGSGCWRIWRRRTRSWWRWIRGGRGSATITCSPTCCSWSCAAPGRTRPPRCTRWRPGGSPGTGTRWRRSGTPRRRRTGGWPPGCSPTTGRACTWTGRPPSSTSWSPGSPPGNWWRMRSWPRWPRGMSWPAGRWRRPGGTWAWRNGRRLRCRRVGAGRRSCCWGWSDCCWPASAGTGRRWPKKQAGLGEELRALALISLGSTELWAARFEEAERHLDRGVALARRIGRPFLEFTGLVYAAAIRAASLPVDRSRQAAELAERHGWADEPTAGLACVIAARVLIWRGRLEEAEPWIQRAERTLRAEAEPAVGLVIRSHRGLLELARGRDADALAAFQAADRLAGRLAEPNVSFLPNRSSLVQTLARLGETDRAEQVLAALGDQDRGGGEMRVSLATLRLAQDDPRAAIAALAPVLDGSAPARGPGWLGQAFLLEAITCDALGDPAAAGRALERALDLAEPDGALYWFLLHPAPGLLERHARQRTAHAALIADILSLLAGRKLVPPPAGPPPPLEALSGSEIRVLRYLPTNLSGPEIAGELYVSHNTVRTHISHLYAKLGTHTRAEAVARARALGLLAPSPLRGKATRPG